MFEFVIAVIVILVVLKIVSNVRKKTAEKANPVKDTKAPASVTKAQENKPAVKPVVVAEPKKELKPEAPAIEPETKVEVIVASQETVALARKESSDKHLPEDSTLRRHYLTQLHSMIESLKSARPTDSTLSRHYDAMISAERELCVNEPAAIERLQRQYKDHKKTAAQKIQQPKAIAEPVVKAEISPEKPTLPEDSMLRRHAITHLNSLSG